MITLTALVARGHHEELAMHVRAARTNGLSVDEIKEVLLQTAIYCGVPGRQHRVPHRAGAMVDGNDRPERRLMTDAFVYAAVRTPFGRFGGGLAEIRPDDLAATVLTGVLRPDARPGPGRDRRGRLGQRQRGRRGQPQRRPDGGAAGRAAGLGARLPR